MKTAQEFVDYLNKLAETYNPKQVEPNRIHFSAQPGSKYTRIVIRGSVYCFINNATGDILKAESYKKPAKGARANLATVTSHPWFAANGGAERALYSTSWLYR